MHILQLKRQRSNEPEGSPTDPRSPNLGPNLPANLPANSPPTATGFGGGILSGVPSLLAQSLPDDAGVGSPLKKQRAGTLDQGTGRPLQPPVGTSASTSAPAVPAPVSQSAQANDEEEEL